MAKSFTRTRPTDKEVLALQTQVGATLESVLADDAMQDDGDWVYVRRSTEQGTGPVFLNGAATFDLGAVWEFVRFKKDRFSRVWVEGLGATAAAAPTLIFKLPAGYRPGRRQMFGTYCNGGACRVDVYADGSVYVSAGTSLTFVTLSGINFLAEG